MKTKQFLLVLGLAILCLCLTACASTPQVDDVTMLEIPGVKWNATPEEVKETLGLTADQILVDAQAKGSSLIDEWYLTAINVPFFGEEVMQVQFRFAKYAGYEEFGLYDIRIYYPDDVDMAAIRDTMIEMYGTGTGKGITQYSISNNKVVSGDQMILRDQNTDALLYCWVNTSKGTDILPKEVQEKIIALYADPELGNLADRDVVLEYLEKNPLVSLYCTDSAGEGNLKPDDLYTCNHVNFSAANYITLIQRFGQ